MDTKKQIEYWIKSAEDDIETSDILISKDKTKDLFQWLKAKL